MPCWPLTDGSSPYDQIQLLQEQNDLLRQLLQESKRVKKYEYEWIYENAPRYSGLDNYLDAGWEVAVITHEKIWFKREIKEPTKT
jgi:hypothetical protein